MKGSYFSLTVAYVQCRVITGVDFATLTRAGPAGLLEPLARFPLVAFRTRTEEVLVHAVALGLILARVWVASI